MSNSLPDFLSNTEYFSRWSSAELSGFASHFQVVDLEEGDVLFQEGDEDQAWYIIMSGRVSIVKDSKTGAAHILAELEASEAFGEMSLLEKRPRMGSALSMEKSIVLKLERVIFDGLLDDHHPIDVGMLRVMVI